MEIALRLTPAQAETIIESVGQGRLMWDGVVHVRHYINLKLTDEQVQSLLEQFNLSKIPTGAIPEHDDILSVPITRVPFTKRVIHILQRMGVETMRDVVQLKEDEMKITRNCGAQSLQHIKTILSMYGLSLDMTPDQC